MNIKRIIQFPIFESRWILWVIYMALIPILCAYAIKIWEGVFEQFAHGWNMTESEWLVIALTFLDMAMIANLIYMIISGSYQSFIERLESKAGERFSSGALKVKMGTSLVVVSAISILKTFVNIKNMSWDEIGKQCFIHIIFVISAWVVSHIEYMHDKAKTFEPIEKLENH